jgi:hypothetical protein
MHDEENSREQISYYTVEQELREYARLKVQEVQRPMQMKA